MIDVAVRNLQWHNREHTMISCLIDWKGHFDHLQGEHPFVAWQDDHYAHCREIFERAAAGKFGRIAEWGVQP